MVWGYHLRCRDPTPHEGLVSLHKNSLKTRSSRYGCRSHWQGSALARVSECPDDARHSNFTHMCFLQPYRRPPSHHHHHHHRGSLCQEKKLPQRSESTTHKAAKLPVLPRLNIFIPEAYGTGPVFVPIPTHATRTDYSTTRGSGGRGCKVWQAAVKLESLNATPTGSPTPAPGQICGKK